jgi:hypothetical protein
MDLAETNIVSKEISSIITYSKTNLIFLLKRKLYLIFWMSCGPNRNNPVIVWRVRVIYAILELPFISHLTISRIGVKSH